MYISGDGITPFQVKIKPDFQPKTILALTWAQASDGNWYATDRGSSADQYECSCRLYGIESNMMIFVDWIQANRYADAPNVVTLYTFNSQEYIFGTDIDYSGSITATILPDRMAQNTWRGFEQPFTVKCISPTFRGGSGALSTLRYLDIGFDGDAERKINKFDTSNRTFFYQEHDSDYGEFTGVYTFTEQEMIQARRFIATKRGTAFTIPSIIGVSNIFGYRAASATVKCTLFEDLGMYSVLEGVPRWKAKIKLVEVI